MDLRKYDISADKDDSIPTPDAPEGQTVANKPREFLKYAPMWAAHPDHDRVRSPCWFPVAPAACFLWAARPSKVTGSAVHLANPAAAVHITALLTCLEHKRSLFLFKRGVDLHPLPSPVGTPLSTWGPHTAWIAASLC